MFELGILFEKWRFNNSILMGHYLLDFLLSFGLNMDHQVREERVDHYFLFNKNIHVKLLGLLFVDWLLTLGLIE